MARKKSSKGPETLWDKVHKFDEDLAAGINSMTVEELRTKLVNVSDASGQIEEAKSNDSDLATLREQLKTANETYTVPLKQNKLRCKLILQTLKERGKL